MSRPSISACLPAYNDGGTIASMVVMADLTLRQVSDDYEIIVGDDQQTSPPMVGLDQEPVFRFISTHLSGIQNSAVLFAPGQSLYDVASAKFGEVVTLTEHFRCLPQIIEFSNQQFYGGTITPLRDRAPHVGWRPVATNYVSDGYRDGSVNKAEAEWILVDTAVDAITAGIGQVSARVWAPDGRLLALATQTCVVSERRPG